MRKQALAFTIATALIATSTWAQIFEVQLVRVKNDGVAGGNVDLKVQMKANGTGFRMGSGNLVFTYNPAWLSQPTLLTAHTFNGSRYTAPTVTEPASGRVSANFEYNSSAGSGTSVGTSFTDVVTIRFTINDPNVADTLRWRTVSPNAVNVFSDDNATQIAAGTLASLAVLPPPVLTSFTPASGPVGTEVTITGSNFSQVTQVAFNGQAAASLVIDSNTQIRATVPPGASTGKITVSNASATAFSASDFLVTTPAGTVILTFAPLADAHIVQSKPTNNYGTASAMRYRNSPTSGYASYFKFEVNGLNGALQGAKLRLFITEGTNDNASAYAASNTYAGGTEPWTETGLTWNNADRGGRLLGTNGPVITNSWLEVNVAAGISGNGTYSFSFLNETSESGYLSSREGANPPQLVIEYLPAGSNAAPVANNDAATTAAGTAVVINVLANDSDADGSLNPTSVTVATAAAHGTTSVNTSNGAITYTPNAGFSGNDSFTYTVKDNAGATSNAATVNITVTAANAAPVANNDAATTAAGTAVVINVLANDSDADGSLNPTSVTVATAAGHGTTSVNTSNGAITYTPNAGFSGNDSFTYTVKDNAGATSNAATVNITVTAANAAPVANNDAATTTAGTAVVINVLANDSDADGSLNPASVTVATAAGHGTTSVNTSNGAITYTPNAGFSGNDSFGYTVTDNQGAVSNLATVAITVTGSTVSSLTFTPIADAFTSAEKPDNNYGSDTELRFRYSSLTLISYLKFEVTGITGSVQSAKLRVYVTTGSNDNVTVYSASNNYAGTSTPWTESGLTWNNADRSGGALATQGPLASNVWREWEVTAAVGGNGTVSFGILNTTPVMGAGSSREGANPPQLIVEFGSSALPRANTATGTTTQTLAAATAQRPPASLQLVGNHPNPFYSHTNITFALPEAAPASLIIYNLTGQVVRKLVDGLQPAGFRQISWNGRDKFGNEVPTGVYFMRLQSGGQVKVKRMILQR
ncbi:Ig-like domain-containing protein [bacterium]|nr:Ig-like domain-containing protein [bacterium]